MNRNRKENDQILNVRKAYGEGTAATYDDSYGDTLTLAGDRLVLDLVRREISRYRQFHPGVNLIRFADIGMGTGIIPEHIDPKSYGLQYMGFDLAEGMLHQAQRKQQTEKPVIDPELTFFQADMHQMPLADKSVDIAVSLYGPLSYSLNPENFFTELARVTHPGSRVLLMPCTARLGAGPEFGTGFSTAHDDTATKMFYGSGQIRDLLIDSGFKNINVKGLNFTGQIFQDFINCIRNRGRGLDRVFQAVANMPLLTESLKLYNRDSDLKVLNEVLKDLSIRKKSETDEPISTYTGPGDIFLRLEQQTLARFLDAGLARHMVATATRA